MQSQSVQAKIDAGIGLIAGWLKENGFAINLKKGKTESLLFGRAKGRNMQSEPYQVSSPFPTKIAIISSRECTYILVVYVDGSLSLISHFQKMFRESIRRLLFSIRNHFDLPSAKAIYHMMILPLVEPKSLSYYHFVTAFSSSF